MPPDGRNIQDRFGHQSARIYSALEEWNVRTFVRLMGWRDVRRWENCPHRFGGLEMLHTLVRLVAALEHLNIGDIRLPDKLTVVRDVVARCLLVVAKCAHHGINCLSAPGGETLESHSRMQMVFLVCSAPAGNEQAQFAEQIKFGNRIVCEGALRQTQ